MTQQIKYIHRRRREKKKDLRYILPNFYNIVRQLATSSSSAEGKVS